MASTTTQMRHWTGAALFSFGFRPFFLGAALWAVLSMVFWIPILAGHLELPLAYDPVSTHAHEFLFGYLGAVVAGFLLTAVPNWTGRLPIVGWRLVGLFAVWLAGRVVMAVPFGLPPAAIAIVDLAFPVLLAFAIAREIVAGKNWRNLIVLAMLSVLIAGNLIFHIEALTTGFAADGYGLRLGLGAGVMMISVIGGRIVPSFTRNWLVKRNSASLPAPPMQRFDKVALVMLVAALASWVLAPDAPFTGAALLIAGGIHLLRMARWSGAQTLAEPLVLVLHAGYAFVPLGALAIGAEAVRPGTFGMVAAQHLWMVGAIGVMTLAVMTRATLGHTGQALTAGAGTVMIYAAIAGAAFTRLAAGAWPEQAPALHALSGVLWIVAFGGFVCFYGPLLARARAGKKL